MGANGWLQFALYLAVLLLLVKPLGGLAVYALQRLQGPLPLNPQHMGAVSPDSSFNTAVSFVSNTNWQGYGGESTMSYLTQMLTLAVQNFLSAASGIAVVLALIRGFRERQSRNLGNFWVDLTRSTLYVLLPLSMILALLLAGQGVVQTFRPYQTAALVNPISVTEPLTDAAGNPVKDAQGNPRTQLVRIASQSIALGPAASQIAIKQLGTNGGGFFNADSAHPFENPTPLSDFLEALAILLIPAALCYTLGAMIGDRRQGWALLAAMLVLFVPLLAVEGWAEGRANPAYPAIVDQSHVESPMSAQAGGNMEGKETRFGVAGSARWSVATTAASNGSVNAMHDSYTPLGGLIPLWLIQLGEVIFGGVGSGLYGMLVFAIVAVFIAGLMVGRTPEYLGKKLESFEMKMASLFLLIPPFCALLGTALGVSLASGRAGTANPGAHGFSEILYAFSWKAAVMITGDNRLTAAAIAAEAGVDDFLAEATPEAKLKLIRDQQQQGRLVAMCGDGTNDAPALAQADVAVAMNTGTQAAKEAGNMVDLDSNPTKLIEIVEVGKQLLITRGSLTTFSIANDVAKYFAIIPAAFAGTYPSLQALNVMHLASPESAILSAVIFNALIIIALIPLALRGVRYRAVGASALLQRNLLLYGVGGLIAPFLGIKLIDMILAGLHLA